MEMNEPNLTFEEELLKKIDQANKILEAISHIKIEGVSKLKNKTYQELLFLRKVHNTKNIKKDHLSCTNLKHLEAVANELIKNEKTCVGIMCNKVLKEDSGETKKLCIDLLLHGGQLWVKVVARNPKALTLVSAGEGYYGQKSILEQAEEYVRCSQQHEHFYKHPVVVFHFAYGIELALADELKAAGVIVEGVVLDSEKDASESLYISKVSPLPCLNAFCLPSDQMSHRINLCVSTMIAYVSALTNGGANQRFHNPVLTQLAQWERERPVKPVLDDLFQGRELYCCKMAANNFRDILSTVGGPAEKKRGDELLKRLTVVEDCVSDKLTIGGRSKLRSLTIFGSGESLKAITATANHAFVRSALQVGVSFAVFLHESRALTEGKQLGSIDGS